MFLGSFVKIVVNNVLILQYIFLLDLLYKSEDFVTENLRPQKWNFDFVKKFLVKGLGG